MHPATAGRLSIGERRRAFAAFILFALLLYAAQLKHNVTSYPFDSALYWSMTVDPGSLQPESFIRGYFFPKVLGKWITAMWMLGIGQIEAFRLFCALVYSAGLTVLLPETYRLLAGGQTSLLRRLWPAVVLVTMLPGLFMYPLSDVPAALLMWSAVYLLLRSIASDKWKSLLFAVLAGCAAGAAYNTRTIYLFSAVLLGLALLLQARERWRHFCCYLVGAILIGLPQLALNLRMHDKASMDPTVAYVGGSLFFKQLVWGIGVQKYETYMADYIFGLTYPDPAGEKLLARVSKPGPVETITDYAAAVVNNPVPFLGVYGRHFINGLDVQDGRVYMPHRPRFRMLTTFACATGLLLATLALAAGPGARTPRVRRTGLQLACLAALLLPALLVIPGAMETRFLLPLHMLLYIAAAGTWSTPAIAASLRARPVLIGALVLLGYAAFFAVSQSTLAQLRIAGAS